MKSTIHEKLRLREPEVTPTDEVLEKTLGSSYGAYAKLQGVLGGLGLEQGWRYYTDGNAWFAKGQMKWTTPRGAKKEKTIYWLSAWEGYFKLAIYFKERSRPEVEKVAVSEKTRRIIAEAKQMGKMPSFPVTFDITADEPLADIYALIDCKKRMEG